MTPSVGSSGADAADALVIGIDVGTTNSKGVACRADGTIVARARFERETTRWHDTPIPYIRSCRRGGRLPGSLDASRARAALLTFSFYLA